MAKVYFNSRDELIAVDIDRVAVIRADGNYTHIMYMRRLATLFFGLFLLVLSVQAQKLTVEKMEVAPMDLSASTQPRNDLNNNPCGLVKVQLATVGASFEGNTIGDAAFKQGEYWVYMTEGSYMLNIKHPNFVPLFVNFRDYDIKGVEQKTTYVLTLLMPQMTGVTIDDGMRYLTLIVEPKNSRVTVDGQMYDADQDGSVSVYLPQGSHSYIVEASGYAPQQGTVEIGSEKVTKEIRLQSVLAQVQISCATPGAQIYVNNQLKGSSPWSGKLAAGNYQIEARLQGYHSSRQTETLAERASRTIQLPALVAMTGNMNVNYKPANAEVWLDGKKLGTSPDVFRNIIIGTHEVELRKEGYASEKKQVTISEGQTASLTGSLTASATNSNYASSSSGAAIETFTVKGVSFNMVRVDGGTFQMGSNDGDSDEKPVHQVTLSTYSIGETEVTQQLWEAVMGSNPSNWKGGNLPVERVSWDDCQTFVQKLNQLTGKRFRLPTEAEWEYAARGGNRSRGYKYSGSNTIGDVAWYEGNSSNKTHPVKTKQANELGLYDMSGNVWEWCQDWKGNYSSNAQTNPTGPSSGSRRVGRGGCWYNFAGSCRSSFRFSYSPSSRNDYLGLRLAL